MGAIKMTEVIDYIGDHYILSGDGKSRHRVWCSSVWEVCLVIGMLSPRLPGIQPNVH